MTCTKEFTLTINPGVDFGELVWTAITFDEFGTGTINWITPGEGGTGNAWSIGTSAQISGANDLGHIIAEAEMVYAGPNRACEITGTIVNNYNGAFGGTNFLNVQYFLNGMLQDSYSMPAGYNGPFSLPFTAQAGILTFHVNQFTSNPAAGQSNPLTLLTSGTIQNL